MKKEYRKLFDISGMRQAGLSYVERGVEIQKKKGTLFGSSRESVLDSPIVIVTPSFLQRIIIWIKRLITKLY